MFLVLFRCARFNWVHQPLHLSVLALNMLQLVFPVVKYY